MRIALEDVDHSSDRKHGNSNSEHLDRDHLDDTEQVQSNNLLRIRSSK